MDRQMIARELVRVARDLTAADVNMFDALVKTYRKLGNLVSGKVSSIKYLEGQTRDDEKIRPRNYNRMMSWEGYTRGDMQAKVNLFLQFEGIDTYVDLEVETPYGKNTWIKGEKFEGILPVDKIVRMIEGALK